MADLTTKYMGLSLKSPLIVGSCGLSSSLENIKSMEKNGAGAVVLKSVFEEEILLTLDKKSREASKEKLLYYEFSETYDYLDIHTRNEELDNYLAFIREIKKEVLMPVFASITSSELYSSPREYIKPLRWIALVSDKINCSIAASGGIHTGETALKQILAGADAVQVVSALYKNGIDYLNIILNEMEKWMDKKGYDSLNQFKGMMSYKNVKNPEIFERVQFMKYYGGIY